MPPKKKYVLVRNEPAAAENYVLTSGNEAAAEEALRALEPKKLKVKKAAAAAENYVLASSNEAAAEEALRALEAPKKLKVKKEAAAAPAPVPVAVAPIKSRKQKYKLVRNAPVGMARPVASPITKPTDEELVRAIPVTLGAEVQAALEEWYRIRGEPLPAEYVGFGATVDADERARDKALIDALYPPEPAPGMPAAPKPLGPKPEFGTPEFWRWTAARRKEIDAERAAAGLPPLPTKKEKEAAKQSRKLAREAKAAAKKK